jgi:hypothetical protein
VAGACVAIGTTVRTPTIGIDAEPEWNVWTVVLTDDALRFVGQVRRLGTAQTVVELVIVLNLLKVRFSMNRLEPIWWAEVSPTTLERPTIQCAICKPAVAFDRRSQDKTSEAGAVINIELVRSSTARGLKVQRTQATPLTRLVAF